MKWVTRTMVKNKPIYKCKPCSGQIFPTSTALRTHQVLNHRNIPDDERLYIDIPVRTLQQELELLESQKRRHALKARKDRQAVKDELETQAVEPNSSTGERHYATRKNTVLDARLQDLETENSSLNHELDLLEAKFKEFERNRVIEADKKEKQIAEQDAALNRYKRKYYDLQGQLQSAEIRWDVETQRLTQVYCNENQRLLKLDRQSNKDMNALELENEQLNANNLQLEAKIKKLQKEARAVKPRYNSLIEQVGLVWEAIRAVDLEDTPSAMMLVNDILLNYRQQEENLDEPFNVGIEDHDYRSIAYASESKLEAWLDAERHRCVISGNTIDEEENDRPPPSKWYSTRDEILKPYYELIRSKERAKIKRYLVPSSEY